MAPASDSHFRRSLLVSTALVVALALAAAASATPVARSASITLTVKIHNVPAISVNSLGVVTVDSTAGTLSIAPGQLFQTAPITVTATAITAVSSFKATGLDTLGGFFSFGGGLVTATIPTEIPCPSASPPALGIGCIGATGLGGPMHLSGTIFAVIVPMLATITVPMYAAGIGVGGFARMPNTPAGLLINAAPFTQGVAKVGYTATSKTTTTWMGTLMGNPLTYTYTHTMSWATVASASGAGGTVGTPNTGTITLVSPAYVNALGIVLPTFTKLEIHFVPEPGTLCMLGLGVAGLAVARRRR